MVIKRYVNGAPAEELPRQPVDNPGLVRLLARARARQLAARETPAAPDPEGRLE